MLLAHMIRHLPNRRMPYSDKLRYHTTVADLYGVFSYSIAQFFTFAKMPSHCWMFHADVSSNTTAVTLGRSFIPASNIFCFVSSPLITSCYPSIIVWVNCKSCISTVCANYIMKILLIQCSLVRLVEFPPFSFHFQCGKDT